MPGAGHLAPTRLAKSDQPLDSRIAELADRQHGVVALRQLESLGLAANSVRARVASGRLHRVYRGVYAVGRARLDAGGRRMAAVLVCGPGAVLSHRTAASMLGLLRSAGARIELSVPSRVARGHPGLLVHRPATLRPEDWTMTSGIPCTTVARTLLDVAAVVSAADLVRAIEAAEKLRVFDGTEVGTVLERAGNQRGAARLRAALASYGGEPAPTREELERRAVEEFARAGLPAPQVNSLIDTAHEQLEVDFAWPHLRLIAEADSWEHHGTRAAFERDRRRDQLLAAEGWAVVRFTWRQLHDSPDDMLTALVAR
jgi:predicted transcriptional regulator of viral defense system